MSLDDVACGRTGRLESPGFVLSEFVLGAGYASAEHAHRLPGVVLPVTGTLRVTGVAGLETAGKGQAILLPGGMPHGEATSEVVRCLLLELLSDDREPSRLFERSRRIDHAALIPAANRLADRLSASGRTRWEHEYEAVELVLLVEGAIGTGESEPPRAWPGWMAGAVDRLRTEFRAPPAMVEVARDAGVSREHLARQFRRATGMSAGEFVRRRRVEEAMRLLRHSRLSVARIAQAAGFVDQSHLTRHLRRYLGITPRRVRSRLQEQR